MINQLDALTYFGHLRAYVNDRYVIHNSSDIEVVLRDKYLDRYLRRTWKRRRQDRV